MAKLNKEARRRRAAALKGHRTRLRNQRKRSSTARKGWVTRRKNLARKRRKIREPNLEGSYRSERYNIIEGKKGVLNVTLGEGARSRSYTREGDLAKFENFIAAVKEERYNEIRMVRASK